MHNLVHCLAWLQNTLHFNKITIWKFLALCLDLNSWFTDITYMVTTITSSQGSSKQSILILFQYTSEI